MPAVDALVTTGLLVDHDLRPAGRATDTQSSYRPAPWLADVDLPILRNEIRELIRFKNADGKLIDYRDTGRTRAERQFLTKVNRSIAEANITISSPDVVVEGGVLRIGKQTVNTDKTSLYRVFNGAWNLGSRYYGGWWQSCPKAYRQHITIDGRSTVELDFSQIHPRLLYAIAGLPLDGDAYVIPGWSRDDGKGAFNTLLNAKTLEAAEGALTNHFAGDASSARRLIDDVTSRHVTIRAYFHSGVGLRLQHIDSEMRRDILREMYRQGVVTLPIHDSFIVPGDAENLLSDVMQRALGTTLRNAQSVNLRSL